MTLEEFDERRVVGALRELYRSRLRARGMAERVGTLSEAVPDGIVEARVHAKR